MPTSYRGLRWLVLPGFAILILFGRQIYPNKHSTEKLPTLEAVPLANQIIWKPRLAQNHSIALANAAINAYNCSFEPTESAYAPNWTCLGPTGKPEGAYATGNGQIHRIVFDPEYDAKNNHTIYAVSHFGGLWKSSSKDIYWRVLNTDTQLPFTTVADMAVHPQHKDLLFIATGDGDYGRIFDHSFSEISGMRITPTQTSGVFRSTDGGITWHPINGTNNQLCKDFAQGGNMRRILINPDQPNIAYIATTNGIYMSENILDSSSVHWQLVLDGAQVKDTEFRGLAIKPGSKGQVVYASGSDIYISLDAGKHWQSMTQNTRGLDLANLPTGTNPLRINVATTKADPDRLYAYIFGKNYQLTCEQCKKQCPRTKTCNGSACGNKKKWAWLYVYKQHQWHKVWEKNSCSSFDVPQRRWMAIAVSPKNPNNVFVGITSVYGNAQNVSWQELISGNSMKKASPYNGKGIHADIHELVFEPNNLNQHHPRLFAGTHGGISINSYIAQSDHPRSQQPGAYKQRWKRYDHGLQAATIWDFDQSTLRPEQIILATQDNGVIISTSDSLSANMSWKSILGGDGYGAMFDEKLNTAWIKNQNGIYRLDYPKGRIIAENKFLPIDPQDNRPSFTRALVGRNHPKSGAFYTAFGELYERKVEKPAKGQGPEDLWQIRSDIGKTVRAGWQREIYSFEISEKKPDIIYIVSSGNEGTPPDDFATEPRIFRTTKGGCSDRNPYGDKNDPPSCFEEIDLSDLPCSQITDTRCPFITAVAINPSDPNQIWISFSGYDENLKVWSWKYDPKTNSASWTNADPHNSLNNLPVNFIAYQKGTNDRLYIGTDAGIWIKDEGKTHWEKYGKFPNVRITGLKLNYATGKIMAATWGRGVWMGDLLPPSKAYENPYLISGKAHWHNDTIINSDIIIPDGARLHIDSCVLYMPFNAKITVHPGAQLRINHAKITTQNTTTWQGIEVLTKKSDNGIQIPIIHLNDYTIANSQQTFRFTSLPDKN